jgi:hypothetical protein
LSFELFETPIFETRKHGSQKGKGVRKHVFERIITENKTVRRKSFTMMTSCMIRVPKYSCDVYIERRVCGERTVLRM